MEHYIRKLSGKKYLARLAENPTVIIPTGACEIYGPQLPMGTDLLAAQKIAEMIADRTGAMIAPTIEEIAKEVGISKEDIVYAMDPSKNP